MNCLLQYLQMNCFLGLVTGAAGLRLSTPWAVAVLPDAAATTAAAANFIAGGKARRAAAAAATTG